MKPTQRTARHRPEPLARQHHPHDARRRDAAGVHRRALRHRPDLEPDDLRQGDLRRRRLRRADRRAQRAGLRLDRGDLLRAGARRPARCDRPLRRRPRAHRRRRRLLLAGGLAADRRRRRGDDRAGGAAARPRPSATTSSSRSPAPRPGCTAIEETIFAGIPINVTLLFDASSTWPRPTPTCAGSSGGSRPGLNPDVASVASIFMSRWDVAVADEVPGRAAQPARPRDRLPRLPRLPRAARLRPRVQRLMNEGARPSGCSGRAPGPRTPKPPTSSTSRASPRRSRSTRCRSRPCKAFADHGEVGEPLPADGGDCERGAGRVRRAPGSTSTRSPRASRRRARRRSTSPGTRCWTRSSAETARGRRERLRRGRGLAGARGALRGDSRAHLRDLFAADPGRGERLIAEGAGLHLDYSKNRVTDRTLTLLGELARERGVEERREAMFAGEQDQQLNQ